MKPQNLKKSGDATSNRLLTEYFHAETYLTSWIRTAMTGMRST